MYGFSHRGFQIIGQAQSHSKRMCLRSLIRWIFQWSSSLYYGNQRYPDIIDSPYGGVSPSNSPQVKDRVVTGREGSELGEILIWCKLGVDFDVR